MKFTAPLIQGRLVKRYKRFFADVELPGGEVVTAHCANTGAMTGIKEEGLRVWLSQSDNPKRKLKYTWELVEADNTLIGALPARANAIAEEAVTTGKIAELTGYESLRREVKYGENSRIDLLLEDESRPPCWVEVKNVHWMRAPAVAEFPDGVTARGAKHLGELALKAEAGERAVQLFVVQRCDCQVLRPAEDIDPAYAEALRDAARRGVEVLAYGCEVTTDAITLAHPMRVETG